MTAAKAIQRLLGCGVGAELFSVDENRESTVALLNDLRHANASGVLPVFHGRLSAVLSMLCGSNIVARGAAPALFKSALPGVRVGQRVSPLAVLLTEKQHEQQQAGPQLLVAEFQFER